MAIDSEQEQPSDPTQARHGHSAFEEAEDEFNPREPYFPILQHLNLPLGTAVLDLSFPELLPLTKPSELRAFPRLLQQTLVVALACADFTIKVFTLPLSPPLPQSKARPEVNSKILPGSFGEGLYREQIITLNGNVTHQSFPKGVSVALVPRLVERTNGGHLSETVPESRTQLSTMTAGRFSDSNPVEDVGKSRWDLLVASHSTDVTGILLIHRIPLPLQSLQLDSESSHHDFLWRIQYLSKPANTIQLHAPLHSEQGRLPVVLIAEVGGTVRIYDCCSVSNPDQGSWSLSLYSGLSMARNVLDAKWALGGKAIVVVTSDGEWGIWDLGTDNRVSGGIPTKFAVNGWIANTSQSLNSSKASIGRSETKTKLDPMTPGTRRFRQKDLFTGPANNPTFSSSGGISVYPISKKPNEGGADELVIIWHGDKIIMIPSLKKHWQNRVKGLESLFGHGQIRYINCTPLGGEVCRSISMFPQGDSHVRIAQQFIQPDLLLMGQRSLELIALPLSRGQKPVQQNPQVPGPIADQQLLARGELDVGGMDRILANMGSSEDL